MIDTSWKGRIRVAKVNGFFSHYDKSLASSWQTCAVGELDLFPDVPLTAEMLEEYSSTLFKLGSEFSISVALGVDNPAYIKRAAVLYKQIRKFKSEKK